MSAWMRSCVGQDRILRAGLLPAQPAGYQPAAGQKAAPQVEHASRACNNTDRSPWTLKSSFARCPTSLNRASSFTTSPQPFVARPLPHREIRRGQ